MTPLIAGKLNDSNHNVNSCPIPILGLGTWKSKTGGEVGQAVKTAIDAGYRHLDCAVVYGNEKEIGEAIQDKIKDGTLVNGRQDLFITCKLFNCFHRKENIRKSLKKSLEDLQIEYVDLYLIHWPVDFKFHESWENGSSDDYDNCPKMFPKISEDPENPDCGRIQLDYVDKLETWKELERLVLEEKLIKYIGLSNFNIDQIEAIYNASPPIRIKPSVLQIECHPYLPQTELIDYCHSKNIIVTAYSPLGGAVEDGKRDLEKVPSPMLDPIIMEIGKKYGVQKNGGLGLNADSGGSGLTMNAGQVCIQWCLQRGVVCIPKSSSEERIKSNYIVELDSESDVDASENGINRLSTKLKLKYNPFSDADMALITELGKTKGPVRYCNPMVFDKEKNKMVPRDGKHPDFPFKELLLE